MGWTFGLPHCALAVCVNCYKGLPSILSWPVGSEICPSNGNCVAIPSFASTLTNQNAWFQPIRTMLFGTTRIVVFWFLICIKMDQSGNKVGTFSLKSTCSLHLGEVHFQFPWRLYSSSLQTVHSNKVSSLSTLQIGNFVNTKIGDTLRCFAKENTQLLSQPWSRRIYTEKPSR